MTTISEDISSETPKIIKIKILSKRKKKDFDKSSTTIITRKCYINITSVGSNIKQTLEKNIANEIEGKCITEGYIKIDSVKIISYSNGVVNGSDISFDVVFECNVCSPVEGMHINCIAKNITKAGIRAELDEMNSPIVIFIARDHNYMSKNFSSIQENQQIKIRVIGQRYELNDTYVSVIGELVTDIQSMSQTAKSKTKYTPTASPSNIDIENISIQS